MRFKVHILISVGRFTIYCQLCAEPPSRMCGVQRKGKASLLFTSGSMVNFMLS